MTMAQRLKPVGSGGVLDSLKVRFGPGRLPCAGKRAFLVVTFRGLYHWRNAGTGVNRDATGPARLDYVSLRGRTSAGR